MWRYSLIGTSVFSSTLYFTKCRKWRNLRQARHHFGRLQGCCLHTVSSNCPLFSFGGYIVTIVLAWVARVSWEFSSFSAPQLGTPWPALTYLLWWGIELLWYMYGAASHLCWQHSLACHHSVMECEFLEDTAHNWTRISSTKNYLNLINKANFFSVEKKKSSLCEIVWFAVQSWDCLARDSWKLFLWCPNGLWGGDTK